MRVYYLLVHTRCTMYLIYFAQCLAVFRRESWRLMEGSTIENLTYICLLYISIPVLSIGSNQVNWILLQSLINFHSYFITYRANGRMRTLRTEYIHVPSRTQLVIFPPLHFDSIPPISCFDCILISIRFDCFPIT